MARREKTAPPAPPVPDPAHDRKHSRWGLIIPFAIAGLVIIGWTGFWIYGRAETARQIDANVERLRSAGYDISWAERRITGYPFRLNVSMTNAVVREPSGWAFAAPQLEGQAFMHGLTSWVLATPQGLTFTRPDRGPVEVKGEVIHASVTGLDRPMPNISFEGSKLAFTPAAGAQPFFLTAADKVQFHLRPGPSDQAAIFLKVDAGKAQLSGLFARMAGDRPISIVWESVISRASAFQGDSWPRAVAAWTLAGGRMTVRQAGITAGSASIGVENGVLTVARDGRLSGSMSVNLREAPRALGAMAETGAIRPEAAMAASAVAAARQGAGDVARADITFQAGQTTLGPVAIGPAPKIY